MYPDESSQSLVYCLRSHNMFGWYIYCLDCVIACDCLINCFYSSLPYLFVWLSCMWFFSFCNDHQFIDVSRYERFSRSTGKWWLRCLAVWAGSDLVDFLLGPRPMYWLFFEFPFFLLNYHFGPLICWVGSFWSPYYFLIQFGHLIL